MSVWPVASRAAHRASKELTLSEMASPSNRKTAQPPEGSEFPPLDIAAVARQRGV